MTDLRWPINLVGFGETLEGDVITQHGEFLGRWDIDENDHPSFTPDGASEHLFFHPFVPMLCEEIQKWHEELS
jgi:hypothetical protein